MHVCVYRPTQVSPRPTGSSTQMILDNRYGKPPSQSKGPQPTAEKGTKNESERFCLSLSLPVPKGDPSLMYSIFSPHYRPPVAAAEQEGIGRCSSTTRFQMDAEDLDHHYPMPRPEMDAEDLDYLSDISSDCPSNPFKLNKRCKSTHYIEETWYTRPSPPSYDEAVSSAEPQWPLSPSPEPEHTFDSSGDNDSHTQAIPYAPPPLYMDKRKFRPVGPCNPTIKVQQQVEDHFTWYNATTRGALPGASHQDRLTYLVQSQIPWNPTPGEADLHSGWQEVLQLEVTTCPPVVPQDTSRYIRAPPSKRRTLNPPNTLNTNDPRQDPATPPSCTQPNGSTYPPPWPPVIMQTDPSHAADSPSSTSSSTVLNIHLDQGLLPPPQGLLYRAPPRSASHGFRALRRIRRYRPQ
jgi:hypothetical protein